VELVSEESAAGTAMSARALRQVVAAHASAPGGLRRYRLVRATHRHVRRPRHRDHDDLLPWLGVEKGTGFGLAGFDPADPDRRLDAVVLAEHRTS
jgi:hypothetical protein